jgi:hypothetical protein
MCLFLGIEFFFFFGVLLCLKGLSLCSSLPSAFLPFPEFLVTQQNLLGIWVLIIWRCSNTVPILKLLLVLKNIHNISEKLLTQEYFGKAFIDG